MAALLAIGLVITGCTSASPGEATAAAESTWSSITESDFSYFDDAVVGEDRLKSMATSEQLPGMDVAAQILGADYFVIPSDNLLDLGFAGVGPFGRTCIILVIADVTAVNVDMNEIAIVIIPRFSSGEMGKMYGIGSIDELRQYADSQSSVCDKS